jgi:hypothetical protein
MKVLRKIFKTKKKLRLAKAFSMLGLLLVVTASAVYGLSMIARAGIDYATSQDSSNYDLIKKISKQVDLPKEDIKIFMKVKDENSLQLESDFYKDVKKDDYVIIYPSLAIIYDANKDLVLKTANLKQ